MALEKSQLTNAGKVRASAPSQESQPAKSAGSRTPSKPKTTPVNVKAQPLTKESRMLLPDSTLGRSQVKPNPSGPTEVARYIPKGDRDKKL
jgi:hypothetical protein